MNHIVEEKPNPALVANLREANSSFRRSLKDGSLILSVGILALGAEAQTCILDAVRNFDDFDGGDPWDDHSIGDVEITVTPSGAEPRVVLIFFKLTRCGLDGKAVLTLSLADEWWACRDAVSPQFGEVG
ncbi:MAG: hypothetical protein ACI89J_003059 [Hyphomicrobiaceae bacterium]|jgi:hypothetical protein